MKVRVLSPQGISSRIGRKLRYWKLPEFIFHEQQG